MSGTGFWWIILSVALYGLIHSILANKRIKDGIHRLVGTSIYVRFYRLFFAVTGAVTFFPSLALTAFLPDRGIYSIQSPWSYLMILIQITALGGLGLGLLQTGVMNFLGLHQAFTSNARLKTPDADKLVVNGLYHWVRHPLYTCSLIFIWLIPTMTWNLLGLNLGITAYLWIGSIYEERKLIEQFGKEYEEYRMKTPRILPGIKF